MFFSRSIRAFMDITSTKEQVDQLKVRAGIEVRGYLAMPSVYERVIDNEQLERVRANAYATLEEIEFFQRGLGRTRGVRFDYHGAAFESPNTLFNLCYLVERKDAVPLWG